MIRRLILASTALVATAACAHAEEFSYRLFVGDAAEPTLWVLDPGAEAAPETHSLASPTRILAGPDGRHLYLLQRDAGVVAVLDSGFRVEDHGDHAAAAFEEAASLLPVSVEGPKPIHFNLDHDKIAIFFDGSGEARVWREAAFVGGDTTPVKSLSTARPHHGVAVPFGDLTIVSVPGEGDGSLPDRLAVVDADGSVLVEQACTGAHGEGSVGAYIAFGCLDGVAVFDTAASPPTSRLLAYPEGLPKEASVRNFLSPRDYMALVGTFGADGLVILDPSSETGEFHHVTLPAPRVAFALNTTGDTGYALLADGRLLRFSALTGRITGELAGATQAYSMDQGVIRPQMSFAGERLAISDPAVGSVVLIDPGAMSVASRIALDGSPQTVLLMAAQIDEH
jgi:hypothetical protein